MPERTLVASATNLLARGFMVVPTDRKAPGGLVVNALFAVARGILRGLAFKLPARAVAVLGPADPKWPAILADQRPLLAELCRTLGLAVVETDDEVRTVTAYTRDALAAGDDVVIVGIDKRYAPPDPRSCAPSSRAACSRATARCRSPRSPTSRGPRRS